MRMEKRMVQCGIEIGWLICPLIRTPNSFTIQPLHSVFRNVQLVLRVPNVAERFHSFLTSIDCYF
jgi:hypothetical protein